MTRLSPAERRELRSVVKSQFKVLRAEIEQRQTEMRAEAEQQLVRRYRENDMAIENLNFAVEQIVGQANKDIDDLVRKAQAQLDEGGRWMRSSRGVSAPRFSREPEDRVQLRSALMAGIAAQVQQATLALDRQEADLLRQLALDALESEAAREFLANIPTVSELVPVTRLLEIEAAFDDGQGGTS